jgi:hypothetical protein
VIRSVGGVEFDRKGDDRRESAPSCRLVDATSGNKQQLEATSGNSQLRLLKATGINSTETPLLTRGLLIRIQLKDE